MNFVHARIIPFMLRRGKHVVTCPACKETTEVDVYLEDVRLRVRTSRGLRR